MMSPINGSAGKSASALPLLRVRPGSSTEVVVQSEDVVYVNTHWLGRRLWCCMEDCPGCQHSPIRTVGYFAAVVELPQGPRPVLIETTPNEMCRLDGFLQMAKLEFKPGLLLEASKRYKPSPVRFEPIAASGRVVDALRPVRRALSAAAVVAGLPLPLDGEADLDFADRISEAVRRQLQLALAKQN